MPTFSATADRRPSPSVSTISACTTLSMQLAVRTVTHAGVDVDVDAVADAVETRVERPDGLGRGL